MSPYLAILSARFRTLLQYRAAAVAGFGTQLFWGLIRMMVYEGFYRSSTVQQPMSWAQVLSYIWLGQAMFALLPYQPDPDVRDMIRSGGVAYELCRPLDLYGLWYSRAVAQRVAPAALRAVPMFLAAGLFFGLRPPVSPAAGLAWMASTLAAILLSAAISNLITLSLLWTIAGDGITQLIGISAFALSGMLVPIPLLPGWAQTVFHWFPFQGLVDQPFRLYSGSIPAGAAAGVLASQLGWTTALVLLGRAILVRGTRRLVVQGG